MKASPTVLAVAIFAMGPIVWRLGPWHGKPRGPGEISGAALPMMQGEWAHPPADACDFARFCSGLDFWSINDHAEAISPTRWAETQESIRPCNEIAGDPVDPDLLSFVGWERTQSGPRWERRPRTTTDNGT